jgi:hypothetical protein
MGKEITSVKGQLKYFYADYDSHELLWMNEKMCYESLYSELVQADNEQLMSHNTAQSLYCSST